MERELEKKMRDQLLMAAQTLEEYLAAMKSPPEDNRGCDDDVEVPYNFFCPLSGTILIDPVLVDNGETYEKSEIKYRLDSGNMICPVSNEVLQSNSTTPNHALRILIREWCEEHNKSHLIQYNLSTPLYITRQYFESLHFKLSERGKSTVEDQKKTAKRVRRETTNCAYFQRLYEKFPKFVVHLISPLFPSNENTKIDPQLQEDLITTLMIISHDEKVKKEIADSLNGIKVLTEALQSENMETQKNAVLTIFEISSINSNRKIVGETNAMLKLATLLMDNSHKLLHKDVVQTLIRLFQTNENKAKAVKEFADAGIFKKIEDSKCVDTMLPIFASLSKLKEGINEIDKCNFKHFFLMMRENPSAEIKDYGTMILYSLLLKDEKKWKSIIEEEDKAYGTISGIPRIGNLKALKNAKAILGYFFTGKNL